MPEGRESPSPSRQTGGQIHDPTGTGSTKPKDEANNEWEKQGGDKGTANLTSNPKGVLDDAVKEKFAKAQ
ncbi:hypothetical protein SCUCBS95973_001857 [Sporothrix curviconia]|uniref:Uncharacterized protein n=1 Tax=Sporothrix curviconia TaxID=1260050 RepID=A0ABP0B233_9PEZI